MAGDLHEVDDDIAKDEDSVFLDFRAEQRHGQRTDTLDHDRAHPRDVIDNNRYMQVTWL